ncbi:MAG: winged helix-turn-helix domain-containing protein [Acidobacteria bacterium]|nr:winged helix-turn-helix domain-containing protein [Acidobacteriota bacterium]
MHKEEFRKPLFHSVKQKARNQPRQYHARPLEHGILILECLAKSDGRYLGVREIASATDVSPATVSRILRILFAAGWITASGTNRNRKYTLTGRPFITTNHTTGKQNKASSCS